MRQHTVKISINNSYITLFITETSDGQIHVSCDSGSSFTMYTNMKALDLTDDVSIAYYKQLKENLGRRSNDWAVKKAYFAKVVPDMIHMGVDNPLIECLVESILLNITCRNSRFTLPEYTEFEITDDEIICEDCCIDRPKSISDIAQWEESNIVKALV